VRAAERQQIPGQRAFDEDLFLFACALRDNVVRIIPPLNVSAAEIGTGVEHLLAAMGTVLPTS